MKTEFLHMETLSEAQTAALTSLRSAVYPPEILETLPARFFTWARPQWSVFLWDANELVARVGLLVREVHSDGVIKKVGGIGGVMTHPQRQGKGYASLAMQAAADRFKADLGVSFALLFCRPHLVDFYKRFGWKVFSGRVFVEQPSGKMEFSANGAMVLDVLETAPTDGELDLNGLPW